MRIAFADTSFYIAFLNPKDASHHTTVELVRTFRGRIVTTEFVLLELGNYLSGFALRTRLGRFIESLRRQRNTHVLGVSTKLFDEGLAIYTRRRDKTWSLTDCISFVVMEQMGLTEALTADRHFEQAGFTILMR